ncbi:cyclin-dependent kinase 4 inhibitor D-like isoform X2 [Patiria miniata]|uniref:SOCS box domain-containing protein n=1 Tax=Patiria miniata TaxID=46514 RepID=A0A913Z9T6_PATMI|nr:cyclin-dependent kinase 4 inhibitor D-like isoform X2 [Patiria miniata]
MNYSGAFSVFGCLRNLAVNGNGVRNNQKSSSTEWERELDVAIMAANANHQQPAAVNPQDEFTRAAANGDMNRLRELSGQVGVDVDGRNKYGRTAIQVMTMATPMVAQFLLEKGADPNVPDPDVGRTPLHDAAEHGHEDTVRWLLAHGADPTAREWRRGNTPAHLAAEEGRPVGILSLLSRGCSFWETNNAGQTPLDGAIANNRQATVQWITDYHSSGEGRTLKHLCRLTIHRALGTQRMRRVGELTSFPLPETLVDYLKMTR